MLFVSSSPVPMDRYISYQICFPEETENQKYYEWIKPIRQLNHSISRDLQLYISLYTNFVARLHFTIWQKFLSVWKNSVLILLEFSNPIFPVELCSQIVCS